MITAQTEQQIGEDFSVVGATEFGAEAIEALARLLIDLVESENKSGSRPQSHASDE